MRRIEREKNYIEETTTNYLYFLPIPLNVKRPPSPYAGDSSMIWTGMRVKTRADISWPPSTLLDLKGRKDCVQSECFLCVFLPLLLLLFVRLTALYLTLLAPVPP